MIFWHSSWSLHSCAGTPASHWCHPDSHECVPRRAALQWPRYLWTQYKWPTQTGVDACCHSCLVFCAGPYHFPAGLHNTVMRVAAAAHAGHVIEQEGDSWSVAFHSPMDAVAFCLQVNAAFGMPSAWCTSWLSGPGAQIHMSLWQEVSSNCTCPLQWICPSALHLAV